MTSTTGSTRPSAVATLLRAGAPAAVVVSSGESRGSAVEPFGYDLLSHSAAAHGGGLAPATPKTDAQLRASVRPRRDL